MSISVITCQLIESLATIRKDAIIGEIKDTEKRIYEIVDSTIIDCKRDFGLTTPPQCSPIYSYACDKLPPNKENTKPYILQQVININQYNGCSFYEGYPLKEPQNKFSTKRWLIEQMKWLIDKVCNILKL